MVKNLPASSEDTRDMGLVPRSGKSPGGGQPTPIFSPGNFHGQRSLAGDTICGVTKNWTQLSPYIGEGNGNPLQYSCLENSVDGGAWWTAVHGVAQSRTRLKQLSMRACIGEGHGNPQYSCLEHPMDRGAWQAMVHRVAELDTTELTRHTQHLGDKNKQTKKILQIVLIGLF